MATPSPLDAANHRIGRIKNVLHPDDLGEVQSDAEGYIDALHEFGHISETDWSRLHKEARAVKDETAAKLAKKKRDRGR